MKHQSPSNSDNLREAIEKAMMDGWLQSLSGGFMAHDGGQAPITKLKVNPRVVKKLEALFKAEHNRKLDELLKQKRELKSYLEADDDLPVFLEAVPIEAIVKAKEAKS